MTEGTHALHLNPDRQSQLFAHLSTYLFKATIFPAQVQQKTTLDLVQDVASRLCRVCGDERVEMLFPLSGEEVQAVKEVLQALEPQYERGSPIDETSALALAHLAACRVLIEEAEQQVKTKTESR